MKKQARTRKIQLPNDYKLCRLHEIIGRYYQKFRQLPDAAAVREIKIRSAPEELVEMVF